jgi:hypothetical protein
MVSIMAFSYMHTKYFDDIQLPITLSCPTPLLLVSPPRGGGPRGGGGGGGPPPHTHTFLL